VNEQEEKYNNSQVTDLIWDDDFRNWVINPSDESEKFFTEWLKQNPAKEEAVEIARQLIKAVQVKKLSIGEDEIELAVKKTLQMSAVESGIVESNSNIITRSHFFSRFLKVAAVFIIVIGAGLLIYFNSRTDKPTTVTTAYGNIKTIVLPDSSTIILNGNSNISFKKDWKQDELREVWLTGEAFFNVRHLKNSNSINKFQVHVKNVTVEVIGTSFDIRQRRDKIEIVLQTGKIKLLFSNRKDFVMMNPGEIITVKTDENIVKKNIQPEEFTAWTNKQLIVNGASLGQIVEYLEDNYGKKFILKDSSLTKRTIEGTIILDNLNDALFVISTVLNVKITNTDSTIYIMQK
jgi:ferric-dicitrate binding protein FerR (iron transport regulator)